MRLPTARRLFRTTVRRFLGRRRRLKRVALDSTGLDCGHASRYYIRRGGGAKKQWQTVTYSRYAELEAAFDCASHLMLAALAGRGPRVDTDRFVPLLDAALANVRIGDALADAGYDSEPNHRHAREARGVRSFIPATAGRPTTKPPTGYYRRRMKQRLDKDYGRYGQRWQAETGFSMFKRRLGTAVNGRSYWSQCRELLLMAITYNIMLLYAVAGFLQSRCVALLTRAVGVWSSGVAPFTETAPGFRADEPKIAVTAKLKEGRPRHEVPLIPTPAWPIWCCCSTTRPGQDLYPFLKNGTRLRSRRG